MKKEAFAGQLLILRARTGLTQEEFAKQLDTTKRSISAWENGDGFPRKAFRIKLANTFGCPITTFLLDDELPSSAAEAFAQVDASTPDLQNNIDLFTMKL